MTGHGWHTSDRRSRLPTNWDELSQATLERDGRLCQLRYEPCTVIATQADHVDRNGSDDLTNLQAVCAQCHNVKTIAERPKKPTIRRPREPHPGLAQSERRP